GVQSRLAMPMARLIARDLVAVVPVHANDRLRLKLEPGRGQGPPIAVARLASATYRLHQVAGGRWALGAAEQPVRATPAPVGPALRGYRLTNVAAAVGLDFRHEAFRYGVTSDPTAMMGGGVCWLDYDNDGWLD